MSASSLPTTIAATTAQAAVDHAAVHNLLHKFANQVYNVTDSTYGAVADGTTDTSDAFQAAIDDCAAAGGGIVVVPPASNYYVASMTLAANVIIQGMGGLHSPSSNVQSTIIAPAAGGTVIDTPGSSAAGMGIANLGIRGQGAATAATGIRLRTGSIRAFVKNCTFDNFADSGLQTDSGSIACTFEDLIAQNCLLDRTRAAKIGAFDINGTDHYFQRCEVTCSQSALSDANAYICAWVLRGSTGMYVQCIGEISDEGFYILPTTGFANQFVTCRADLNFGHGWHVGGSENMWAACLGYRNSQETDNTYSGWIFDQTTGCYNLLVGCTSTSLAADAKHQKYGFESNYSGAANLNNQFIGCMGAVNDTGLFKTQTSLADMPVVPRSTILPADSDTTPSVLNRDTVILSNYVSATNVTNFDDGVNGQRLMVLGDPQVTIKQGATIKTNTGADVTLAADRIYAFVNINGVWYME